MFGRSKSAPQAKISPLMGTWARSQESSTVVQSVVLGLPVLGKMGLLLEMPCVSQGIAWASVLDPSSCSALVTCC